MKTSINTNAVRTCEMQLISMRKSADTAIQRLAVIIENALAMSEVMTEKAENYRGIKSECRALALEISELSGLFIPDTTKLWKELPLCSENGFTKEADFAQFLCDTFKWTIFLDANGWRNHVRSAKGLVKEKSAEEKAAEKLRRETEKNAELASLRNELAEEKRTADERISDVQRHSESVIEAMAEKLANVQSEVNSSNWMQFVPSSLCILTKEELSVISLNTSLLEASVDDLSAELASKEKEIEKLKKLVAVQARKR